MKVVLDANALMVPEQFGVKIFSELPRLGYTEYLVPEQVMRELSSLVRHADKGRDRVAAKVGLGLAEGCKVISVAGEAVFDADMAIEKIAIQENAAVFTNDKALKKKLIMKGITVIYLRQGRYLEATEKEY
jgi:rRNA-processing protein FCF1